MKEIKFKVGDRVKILNGGVGNLYGIVNAIDDEYYYVGCELYLLSMLEIPDTLEIMKYFNN